MSWQERAVVFVSAGLMTWCVLDLLSDESRADEIYLPNGTTEEAICVTKPDKTVCTSEHAVCVINGWSGRSECFLKAVRQ